MPLRLLVFFVGLGCVAFGVAVTTKALLGTILASPLRSPMIRLLMRFSK